MSSSPEASAPQDVRVLVVDEDEAFRSAMAAILQPCEVELYTAGDGRAALDAIEDPDQPPFDVIFTELRGASVCGLEILRTALRREAQSKLVMMSADVDVETAVAAMRHGAFDFIQKPIEPQKLEQRVMRVIDDDQPRKLHFAPTAPTAPRHGSELGSELMIIESKLMRDAFELAQRVAGLPSTVMISGETGTGKEVIASFIHRRSRRASGPFVKVNCAALPEPLLESELFGHELGAFTGADRLRRGRFEEASGGTLLLDEISETSSTTQAKLLRVLQDQEFHRLGGTTSLRTDARILSASNCDLLQAVADGRFREDLYYRLNVIEIHLPPLRDRPQDARALARTYLERFASEQNRPLRGISEAAMARILSYSWPGNVRQLRNVMERAVLLARGPRIEAEDLLLDGVIRSGQEAGEPRVCGLSLAEAEREWVLHALRRTGFVQKDAAKLLEVSRRKLNYMIRRMGLTHPSWRRNRGSNRASRDKG